MLEIDLAGAEVLRPDGSAPGRLSLAEGRIVPARTGRTVDLAGYRILPGIVDLHGDGFERHMAPRRGVVKEARAGILAAEAEIAANGITTAVMAQFVSWEGGLRGRDFADTVFSALRAAADHAVTDLRPQLRFETHMLDLYADLPAQIAAWGVDYVVFNDHLPHTRLAEGRKPPRLTGQALKAGRNPEAHFQMLLDLHARRDDVPPALDALCAVLRADGIRLGSHDDRTADQRAAWHARGVHIAEFPETVHAAEAAHAAGDGVVLGAPNVVRGGSHKGNVSALDLVAMGLCDAIASDYHYPSPLRAALMLARGGLLDLPAAWALVSARPAALLGLTDRGHLVPGQRADLVILDAHDRVAATIAGGQVSHLSGPIAERFVAAG